MKGKLITFEGLDGSGKTTLIEKVSGYLSDYGGDHICTREPGSTLIGEKIREVVLETEGLSSMTRYFLFQADRAEHIDKVINPALEAGKIVLCDRYIDSTTAYQGYGSLDNWLDPYCGGKDAHVHNIKLVTDLTSPPEPDLTVLLDISVEESLLRIGSDRDHFEKDEALLSRVHRGYSELSKPIPGVRSRWKTIDASLPAEAVFNKTVSYIRKLGV